MPPLSVADRAWGFTRAEYVEALGKVLPQAEAEVVAGEIFARLESNPEESVGGDNRFFALMSLVSDSTRAQVLKLRKWDANELRKQQEAALRQSSEADEEDE